MRVFHGFPSTGLGLRSALTIGNFDGVHCGHQAMLSLLRTAAQERGLSSTVLTFEPHPREYFARVQGLPAPPRVMTLRDKLLALKTCGVDQVLVMRFDRRVASLGAEAFVQQIVVNALGAGLVLVGDDFRFGAKRAGDFALLSGLGARWGYEAMRMPSFELDQLRVSSSGLREALAVGNMEQAQALLGRYYRISGHVVHGRKLGRDLGFPTLNLRFAQGRPAAGGIYATQVLGLSDGPLPSVSSLGVRPTVEDAGRVLLEVHCLQWPHHLGVNGAYGKIVTVDLLHKIRDEARYEGLDALTQAIAQDVSQAQSYFASTHVREARHITRDRI